VNSGQGNDQVLDAGIANAATVLDDLLRAHSPSPDIDNINRSPFDLVEGTTDFFAMATKHFQLSANRINPVESVEIAGIRVLGNKSQGLLLASTANENRRMRLGKRLRRVERLG
jgi:hypothetical protein